MAEMALIKYHYAYDESKQVININDVSSIERSKHSYYCVGCGAEMIPRLGKIKLREHGCLFKGLMYCHFVK